MVALACCTLAGSPRVAAQADQTTDLAPAVVDSLAIDRLIQAAARFESGQSLQPLRRLEQLSRDARTRPELRRRLELGLVRLLAPNSTVEAKQFACQQLAMIGTEDSLPALARLLVEPSLVVFACQALSTHPSSKASEVLRQALPSLDREARLQVMSTLGDRLDAESVPQLIALADQADREVASAAILALGKIGNEPARAAIAGLRKQGNAALAKALIEASMTAAEKLTEAGEKVAASAIYQDLLEPSHPDNVRRGAFEALLQLDEDAGEQRILDTLRGSDALLKPVAISGVRALRSESTSAKLAQLLPTLPPAEQVWLIQTLSGRRDAAARSAVERGLTSTDATVRLGSIEALAKTGDPAVVAPLLARLAQSANPRERTATERALASLRGGNEIDVQLADAFRGGASPLRRSLVLVMERRGNRLAVPALLDASDDPDTAELALRVLGGLAVANDVPVLLDRLVHLRVPAARLEAEAAVAQALGKIENRERRAEAILGALAQSPGLETRCSLLRLLPIGGEPRSLGALRVARRDANEAVRDTAIRALAEWPNMTGWEALVETYREAGTAPHRAVVWSGLVRLVEEQNGEPNDQLIDRYRTLFALVRSDDDRKQCLGALSGVAHPGALSLAVPLLSRDAVRAEAEMAVKKIAAAVERDHPRPAAEALRRLDPSH